MHEQFDPPRWLSGAHVQSILPSLPLRRFWVERRARPLLAASRELLLDCGEGVRLQGFFSAAPPTLSVASKTLAVLLHGWEGSARSLYVLSLAQTLHEHGYDVVRLNLRDHGDTHHLNRELFHSCRLPEVVGAIKRLQFLFPSHRLVLAGFSLGGNFMLRAAAEAARADLRIDHAFGVSPVLDPATCLDALETGWSLYHDYFVRKWLRSLRLKQQAWPGAFEFGESLKSGDLRAMTRELVLQHSGYATVEEYFRGYAITEDRLAGLGVPATVITALDDPIIPAKDLARLARPPTLRVIATPTGGHCGFFDSFNGPGWADRFILRELGATLRSA
jgi:predicted alpha/beta-fold hydrolase